MGSGKGVVGSVAGDVVKTARGFEIGRGQSLSLTR